MLATLRHRNFALLWFGGLISLTGDWILRVALPFHVYRLTGSILSTGLMFIATTLPGVVLGSIAGVFVDRWDRKQTLVVASLSQGLLILLLLTAQSVEWLWIVYPVAFVESLIAQFFGPAENALLPNLVAKEHLTDANSLNTLNNNLALLVGPALGGALIGWLGLAGIVLLDSASFFIAGAMIWLINERSESLENKARPSEATATATMLVASWKTFWREWVEGLQLVTTNRSIGVIFVAGGIAVLGEGIFTVLLIPFVELLNGGALAFGWLLTIRGLGGLIGGLMIGLVSRFIPPNRMFPLSLGLIGLLALIMYNAAVLGWALVILFMIGVPAMGAQVSSQTLFQTHVADQLRGRVFGAFGTTIALLMLSGQGLASLLGDRIGIVVMLNIGAGLYIFAGGMALVMLYKLFQPVATKNNRA